MTDNDQGATFWGSLSRATRTVFVTPTIMALNTLVFVLMLASGVSLTEPTSASLVQWGADFGPLSGRAA